MLGGCEVTADICPPVAFLHSGHIRLSNLSQDFNTVKLCQKTGKWDSFDQSSTLYIIVDVKI